MTREWKPGDVAMVQIFEDELLCSLHHDNTWRAVDGRHCMTDKHDNVRPLVVIDPESVVDTNRLAFAYESLRDMQAALRSLVEPLRPEEPTGQYALVVADGVVWCRAAWLNSRPWSRIGTEIYADWSDMKATKVLSPGIEATA